MKKIIFTVLLLSGVLCSAQEKAGNPLVNTEWEGVVSSPYPVDAVFSFKTDTVELLYNGMSIETMKYRLEGSNILLTKISGGSPCDTAAVGKYSFKIENNKLFFTYVNDNCEEREMAFDYKNGYTKAQK